MACFQWIHEDGTQYRHIFADRMVVGFTTTYAITTNTASSNPAHGEVYNIM